MNKLNLQPEKKVFSQMKTIFITLFAVLTVTVDAQTTLIKGTVTGMNDQDWLYLRDAKSQILIDSTMVYKNQFQFRRQQLNTSDFLILTSEDENDFLLFWPETGIIQMNLKKGIFRTNAEITGIRDEYLRRKFLFNLMPFWNKQSEIRQHLDTAIHLSTIRYYTEELINVQRLIKLNTLDYVTRFPKSRMSLYLLHIYAPVWGRTKSRNLYKIMPPAFKNSETGKDIFKFITVNKLFKVGDRYSDFQLPDSSGKMLSASSNLKKITLIHFWASWCAPCREENPYLIEIFNYFKDYGFNILGISVDRNRDSWIQAIEKDKLPWNNVCDFKGEQTEAALIYGITGVPSNILIDGSGKIIAFGLRGDELKNRLHEIFVK